MARPRVFISSTHHDLKHVRMSLGDFVDALGFEPVLSENGGIAYAHDRALDESCYREVADADIFVLLIGKRYGAQASAEERLANPAFHATYTSITHREFERARLRNLPTYVAIDKDVLAEFEVYKLNAGRTDIAYRVDSANVFRLVADVLSQPSVPVLPFDRIEEIQSWLRAQWAGNYRDLLGRQTELAQLSGLAAQIGELKQISETLKKYMEAVLKGADPNQSARLIAEEDERLHALRLQEALRSNGWTQFMERTAVRFSDYHWSLEHATTATDFVRLLRQRGLSESKERLVRHMLAMSWAQRDINEARSLLLQPAFDDFAQAVAVAKPAGGTKRGTTG
jgi:hypothetical protein